MNDSTTPFAPWQTSEPVIDAYIGFLHLQLSTCGVLRVQGRKFRRANDIGGVKGAK